MPGCGSKQDMLVLATLRHVTTLNTDLYSHFLPKSCMELTKCFDFQDCFSNQCSEDDFLFESSELEEV